MSSKPGAFDARSTRQDVISVVIVAGDDVEAALDAAANVDEDLPGLTLQHVIVGSGDDLRARVSDRLPDATSVVVAADTNLAAARNAGAENARGAYLAFVERDAVPGPRWLGGLVDTIRANANAALAASKVLYDDRTVAYADAALTFTGEPISPRAGKPDSEDAVRPFEVLYPSSWAFLVETKAFRWVGGFDSELTPEVEHVDLGWRLWIAGLRVVLAPESVLRLAPNHRYAQRPPRSALGGLGMLYKNLGEASFSRAIAASLALADDATIPAFRDSLGALGEARATVQSRRQVLDSEILPLFRRPTDAGTVDELAADEVRRNLDIDAIFAHRNRILVVTPDVLQATMAGPAIRAWQMAQALNEEHEVQLVTTVRCDLTHPDFVVRHVGDAELQGLVAWADVVIFQGHIMANHPWLRHTDTILVGDIYDPMHLEVLEQARDVPPPSRREAVRVTVEVLNEQLARGDFFLCASDKQRDFWIGQLAGVGRINPAVYDDHENLDNLITVVPFGISDEVPVATRKVLKGVLPGIAADDKVILWGGGVYNWFDPLTLIHAVDHLRARVPNVRLYFMGMKHPNPLVPAMQMASRTRRLANDLGLVGEHVFFNEDWVPYHERQNYLLEADVGVSTHLDHVETAFSFRTRILDYLWTSLPIVATAGDSFAGLIESRGLGITVPPDDVDALEAALFRLLTDENFAQGCREAVTETVAEFRWERVLEPILEFCRHPQRAADLVDPRQRVMIGDPTAQAMWGHGGLRHTLKVAIAHLRNKEYDEVSRKLRMRLRLALFPDSGGPGARAE